MMPHNTIRLTSLLAILLTITAALPVNEQPKHRHLDTAHHTKKLYATSESSHDPEDADTRDISYARQSGNNRYKTSHERREMSARDLKRAARQSRKKDETSQEQQASAPGWLSSLTKLFGIGVNEEENGNVDNTIETEHDRIEPPSPQGSENNRLDTSSLKESFDVHHPADYGIDEEGHVLAPEAESAVDQGMKSSTFEEEELLTKTDLRDLVRLFRRMFTTIERELNQTDTAPAQEPSSAINGLNLALAQAQTMNRRKDLEKRQLSLQGSEEDTEPDEVHSEHDHRLEVPLGSPAYGSRKRILRGLNGVAEKERAELAVRRRAVIRRRSEGDDREHYTQAMSAGLLPYL
ncbi:unnamed protein product [Agarophyton chilense]|eukprot:gb/GEZJ01001375.1/.p2 GENE.gb/GEZJ01001375.1/~~gb/GEZJ01001375.1/.p2  ORF type:complete len:350 (-),score=57.14 gb/GEZJ01001375.1/:3319-4368(-)